MGIFEKLEAVNDNHEGVRGKEMPDTVANALEAALESARFFNEKTFAEQGATAEAREAMVTRTPEALAHIEGRLKELEKFRKPLSDAVEVASTYAASFGAKELLGRAEDRLQTVEEIGAELAKMRDAIVTETLGNLRKRLEETAQDFDYGQLENARDQVEKLLGVVADKLEQIGQYINESEQLAQVALMQDINGLIEELNARIGEGVSKKKGD